MKRFEQYCYGIGIIPEAMVATIVSLYLLFFSTDILGLKSSSVGLILLLANGLDVVTDLIIMTVAGKKKTRFGSYRPWLFSAIPMALCLMLIFLFPDFLQSNTGKLIWIGVLCFLMVPVFETAYLCPYFSLRIVMSPDKNIQMRLSSFISAFENFGQLLAVFIALIFVSGNLSDLTSWRACMLCIVGISVISTLLCFLGTKERIETHEKQISISSAVRLLVKEKSFMRVVFLLIIIYIPWMMYSSIAAYFFTYNLGHGEWMNPMALISLAYCIGVSLVVTPIVRHIGKKKMITVSAILLAVSALMFNFVTNIWTLVLFCAVKDFGQISIYICAHAYVPEVNSKIQTEKRIAVTGIIIGITSAFAKIGIALGNYLSSVILTLSGYDAALSVQSDATLSWIRFSICALFLAAAAAILLINRKGVIN